MGTRGIEPLIYDIVINYISTTWGDLTAYLSLRSQIPIVVFYDNKVIMTSEKYYIFKGYYDW